MRKFQQQILDVPIPHYDQNPDGSYTKIIFYNASINALLKHEDEMYVKR